MLCSIKKIKEIFMPKTKEINYDTFVTLYNSGNVTKIFFPNEGGAQGGSTSRYLNERQNRIKFLSGVKPDEMSDLHKDRFFALWGSQPDEAAEEIKLLQQTSDANYIYNLVATPSDEGLRTVIHVKEDDNGSSTPCNVLWEPDVYENRPTAQPKPLTQKVGMPT
jgi:hypothetical protein